MSTTSGGPPGRPAAIEFRAVSKRYGSDARAPLAVDGIDFSVARGTLTTLLGPSGCGKTTTLRMIAGLESPTSGQILIDGRDVTGLPAAERDVSMVFQSYALFPHMTVLGNVGYGLSASGVSRGQTRERALGAMQSVGLEGMGERLPSELSGGQQQRVALARALVLEPAVLLFDEPLSNLDARLRRAMREEIRSLQQRLGLTVAYVTHDQGEAMAVSDQVVVMDHGRIAQAGTPRELYERPASEFVATFMGEAVLFDAVVAPDGGVRLGPLAVRTSQPTPSGAARVAVRPEAWDVRPAGTTELAATVLSVAYLGSIHEYTFDTALGRLFVVRHGFGQVWKAGDVVSLGLGEQGFCVLAR